MYSSEIRSLSTYSISYGGFGPTLTDSCIAKKGIINIGVITEMKEKYVNRDKTSDNYGKVDDEFSNFYSFYTEIPSLNKKEEGFLNGADCYNTNHGSQVTLIKDIHEGKYEKLIMPLNTDGDMPDNYVLNHATSGGGGAVVITW